MTHLYGKVSFALYRPILYGISTRSFGQMSEHVMCQEANRNPAGEHDRNCHCYHVLGMSVKGKQSLSVKGRPTEVVNMSTSGPYLLLSVVSP